MKHEKTFRGQRKDNGEWVEGDLIQGYRTYILTSDKKEDMTIGSYGMICGAFIEVIPETVGQFTGRKNVWEGSIVEYERRGAVGRRYRGAVEWSNDACGWEIPHWVGKPNASRYYTVRLQEARNVKVLGSIHTNLELLKA